VTSLLLSPGTPSAVGSLPHLDAVDAARAALALTPELPAAPQLPNRSRLEGMLAQVAVGAPGLRVDEAGGLVVDRRRLAGPADDQPLDVEAWAGTLAFLAEAARVGHRGPIKVQVAGPVTFGLALAAAGVKASRAFPIAGAIVRQRVQALLAETERTLPGTPVVLVLDEPGLTAYPADGFPLGADDTIDLLSGGLAAAKSAAMAGVHCCGPTDWRLVLHAGPDLLSMPVDASVGDDAVGLSAFLDRGGWIAWGAVPTDRPIGDREDVHWRQLTSLWCDLSRNGCDPMRLRTQAILTPACGLAFHRPEQVAPVHELVRRVAERVQDQALAARMSAGA
jgi:hypothetical protein